MRSIEVVPNGQSPWLFEMWQGSQNLRATQKESCAQNEQTTAVRYISDTEEIIKACWSNFQHDGEAAFKLSEKSPVPPALCAKDLPGGQTQVLNVRPIKRIDHRPVESADTSLPESVSHTENRLNWNGDFDHSTDSKDEWEAVNESDIELDDCSENSETPEQRNVSATQNVPGLIPPIWQLKKKSQKALMMVNIMETRRNKGIKKNQDRMRQGIITKFIMQFDREFNLEKNMGEYWVVLWENWLINKGIVGNKYYLARCINFNRMRATSARILLGSASP